MMDYQRIIVDSNLGSRLGELASFLLEHWLECAKCEYDISDIDSRVDFNRYSAQDDLIDLLFDALESLSKTSSESTMSFYESYGFICGFVQSGLNVKWTDRFIVEYTSEYRDTLKLKTVLEILKHDKHLAKKVEIVYAYYLDTEIIWDEQAFNEGTLAEIKLDEGVESGKRKYITEFCDYYERAIVKGFYNLHRKYGRMCCPDLTHYINEREVRELLDMLI